jgi:formylglycine-generating enzyme
MSPRRSWLLVLLAASTACGLSLSGTGSINDGEAGPTLDATMDADTGAESGTNDSGFDADADATTADHVSPGDGASDVSAADHDAAPVEAAPPPCTPGTQQCSGTGVQTCSPTGTWGAPWPCTTGKCSSGACVGSTAKGTSCTAAGPGLTDCGPNTENCCTSLEVPGGTFYRTYERSDAGPTGEADPATVSNFELDKYAVTVGRFRQFVSAWNNGTGYLPPAGSGKHAHLNGGQGLANSAAPGMYETGWSTADNGNIAPTDSNLSDANCDPTVTFSTWTPSPGPNEHLPINCLNWYEAEAFCIWDGGFLPSEAEREYAASGGTQQYEYAWGSTDPGTTNQYAIYGCYYNGTGVGTCTGVTNIAPVGTPPMGTGQWGQLDLAGNMYQWVLDWFEDFVSPCTDCAYLNTTSARVLKGGYFFFTESLLTAWYRDTTPPTFRDNGIGTRCARTP